MSAFVITCVFHNESHLPPAVGILVAHCAKVRDAKQIISIDCVGYRLDRVQQVPCFLALPSCGVFIETFPMQGIFATFGSSQSAKSNGQRQQNASLILHMTLRLLDLLRQ